MNDPVTVNSGQTYDRSSLVGYFAAKGNPSQLLCPLNGTPINKNELQNGTNIFIKNSIEKFVSTIEAKAKEQNNAVRPAVIETQTLAI